VSRQSQSECLRSRRRSTTHHEKVRGAPASSHHFREGLRLLLERAGEGLHFRASAPRPGQDLLGAALLRLVIDDVDPRRTDHARVIREPVGQLHAVVSDEEKEAHDRDKHVGRGTMSL
jgi:hypothetical protein